MSSPPISPVIITVFCGEMQGPCGDKWLNTIVVLNARTEPIKVNIPEGKYWIACRDGKIDLVLGLGIITGNQITVSPRSAMIIHQ